MPFQVCNDAITGKTVCFLSEVTPEATPEVERLIRVMDGEKGRLELQLLLALKDEKYFRNNFMQKVLDLGLIEMTIPGKPTSGNQKYRLTALGKKLKEKLEGQAF